MVHPRFGLVEIVLDQIGEPVDGVQQILNRNSIFRAVSLAGGNCAPEDRSEDSKLLRI